MHGGKWHVAGDSEYAQTHQKNDTEKQRHADKVRCFHGWPSPDDALDCLLDPAGQPGGFNHPGIFAKFRSNHRPTEAAGLDDVRMHDLRRTLATRAAASGVSLPVLRDVLGHAQITMAARYARMADAAVAAAIESSGGGVAAALRGRRG